MNAGRRLAVCSLFLVVVAGCGDQEVVESGLQSAAAGDGDSILHYIEREDGGMDELLIPEDDLPDLGNSSEQCTGESGASLFPDDDLRASFDDVPDDFFGAHFDDHGGALWELGREAARLEIGTSVTQHGNVINTARQTYRYGRNDYVFHFADADNEPVTLDIDWSIEGDVEAAKISSEDDDDEMKIGRGTSRISLDFRLFDPVEDCREVTDELGVTAVDFEKDEFNEDDPVDDATTVELDTSRAVLWVTVNGEVQAGQDEMNGVELEPSETTAILDASLDVRMQ